MFLFYDLYEKCMYFHARLTSQGTPQVNQMPLKTPNLCCAGTPCACEISDRQLCWPKQPGIHISDVTVLQAANIRMWFSYRFHTD